MSKEGPETADAKNGISSGGKSSTLRIEDRSFYVVPATSASMELLVDYLRLIINIELITTDAMAKIVEYLKVRPQRVWVCLAPEAPDPSPPSSSHSTPALVRSFSAPVPCVRPG